MERRQLARHREGMIGEVSGGFSYNEIRDVFSRVEANSASPGRVVQRPWGTVELFFGDALEPSAADLQKAVLRANTGAVKDFYFSGGDVVFVFRRGASGRPPRMAGENEGDRYYFRRGARFRLFISKQRMIYWIAPGKRVVSPDHLDYGGTERTLLREAREVLRTATS